jgi:hypothetical protein
MTDSGQIVIVVLIVLSLTAILAVLGVKWVKQHYYQAHGSSQDTEV